MPNSHSAEVIWDIDPKVIKGRLSAVTKSRDEQLAKQQSLLLDAVDPKGELSQKTMMEAAQTALKLLGDDPSMPAESKESWLSKTWSQDWWTWWRMMNFTPLQPHLCLGMGSARKQR